MGCNRAPQVLHDVPICLGKDPCTGPKHGQHLPLPSPPLMILSGFPLFPKSVLLSCTWLEPYPAGAAGI